MTGQKKLIAVIEPKKPISQMSEKELDELADYVIGQVRGQVPAPKPKS